MMHVLMTGASGRVGRFIAHRLRSEGHRLSFLGRSAPENADGAHLLWDLAQETVGLPSAEVLVHCALAHVAGKYRGGEGDDPHGFIQLNVAGTARLFEAAKSAGVRHIVFLSSRAVYSEAEDWTVLTETSETEPASLYGQVKLAGEHALEMLCDEDMAGTVLRATGVYGNPPGLAHHKWAGLFASFSRGEVLSPRLGTEVHGDDLAAAVALLLDHKARARPGFDVFNVSDILLDRRDLLAKYAALTGITGQLPAKADQVLGVMDCGKLKALGWCPGGQERLLAFLDGLEAD